MLKRTLLETYVSPSIVLGDMVTAMDLWACKGEKRKLKDQAYFHVQLQCQMCMFISTLMSDRSFPDPLSSELDLCGTRMYGPSWTFFPMICQGLNFLLKYFLSFYVTGRPDRSARPIGKNQDRPVPASQSLTEPATGVSLAADRIGPTGSEICRRRPLRRRARRFLGPVPMGLSEVFLAL